MDVQHLAGTSRSGNPVLSSDMIRGVGRVYAKKLVRAFGEKVFDVIEAIPARLREVDDIGPVRAGSILAAWAEQKAVREIMVFLHSHGVGTARAVRIFKTYGADAIQVMTENPYRLARDIRGIGFKTADAIAMKLGIEKTAMIRVRAGISYALNEAMDEGHCGLPTDELVPLAEKLLEVAEVSGTTPNLQKRRTSSLPSSFQYPVERHRELQQRWGRLLQRTAVPHKVRNVMELRRARLNRVFERLNRLLEEGRSQKPGLPSGR
jgi:5'-3' exonuclease